MKLFRYVICLCVFVFLSNLSDASSTELRKLFDQAAGTKPLDNTTTLGNFNGDVTIVEFFDYQCGYCKKISPILFKLSKMDRKVRIVFREYPAFGMSSIPGTLAALASTQQNRYLSLHQAFLESHKPLTKEKILNLASLLGINTIQLAKDMQKPIVIHRLKMNTKLASELNLYGTPTFYIGKTYPRSKRDAKVFTLVGYANLAKLQYYVNRVRKLK